MNDLEVSFHPVHFRPHSRTHPDFHSISEESYGKKSLSCCPITSISFSCQRLYRIRKSLPIGSGSSFFLFFSIPPSSSLIQYKYDRRTKKKDIYVISTPKRPVPLEHFLYAGKELHKVVDWKGSWLSSGCVSFSLSFWSAISCSFYTYSHAGTRMRTKR